MSVATKNPFALLDEEAPEPAPQKVEAQAASPTATRGNAKTRGGPASRGGKYYARGGKPGPKDGAPAEEPAADNQRKSEGYRGDRGDRGGRGRGRGRGDRGSGGGGGRGRTFDKHSQTGKTDSDKKIHQGWGGDDGNAEFKAEEAATVDAVAEGAVATEWGGDASGGLADWGAPAESSADAWAAPAEGAPAGDGEAKTERPGRREREPEEEDNTLTLDQYLAQQKEKDSVIPKLESTRKANDGDDSWEGVVPLAKNEEEDAYFVGKSKSAPKARAKKEEKVFIEIEARFDRPDRGGRGRGRGGDRAGDRGGDRAFDRGRGARSGRGGRGGMGGRGNATVVNVDDQTAFPSLA